MEKCNDILNASVNGHFSLPPTQELRHQPQKSINKFSWFTLMNEWYPRWIQISLHIRYPRSQMGGGGILGHSDLDSDNFHLGGGYSGTLRFGLSDNFHWGGILGHSDLDSLTIFIWGVFWDTQIWTLWQFSFGGILGHSDLDSLTIFILGGYSGTLGFGLSDNFHVGGGILGHSDLDSLTIFMWGGILGHSDLDSLTIFIWGGILVPSYYRIGVFFGIWTKISTTPAGSCITDSLSHVRMCRLMILMLQRRFLVD